ncbi:MAG: DUF3892 domain-containing protein [bacterium]|nr:DUF3892 domain-containing protein [bacterium]
MARITVTRESETGRNEQFHDNQNGKDMSRPEFVSRIENGEYKNFHVRTVHGVKTPVSNPDNTEANNLG